MDDVRMSKNEYYLNIAKAVALRSTCLRRQYGAIIVKNDEIISTGYNGSPRGVENCIDTKVCLRNKYNIPSGERYELCTAVHAEMNCIISAARKDMIDSILYLYGLENGIIILSPLPCSICAKLILNSGIKEVRTIAGFITRNKLIDLQTIKNPVGLL